MVRGGLSWLVARADHESRSPGAQGGQAMTVASLACCVCEQPIHNVTTYLDGFPCHYACALPLAGKAAAPRPNRSTSIGVILTAEQEAARKSIHEAIARRQHFTVHGLA